MKYIILVFILLFLNGCDFKDVEEGKKIPSSGMKCGAGKCGANMFDGNSALAKKKKNILGQMKENDTRKDCVIDAKTTKAVYDCIRDEKTNKLTTKCGADKCGGSSMKCGAGKCGAVKIDTH